MRDHVVDLRRGLRLGWCGRGGRRIPMGMGTGSSLMVKRASQRGIWKRKKGERPISAAGLSRYQFGSHHPGPLPLRCPQGCPGDPAAQDREALPLGGVASRPDNSLGNRSCPPPHPRDHSCTHKASACNAGRTTEKPGAGAAAELPCLRCTRRGRWGGWEQCWPGGRRGTSGKKTPGSRGRRQRRPGKSCPRGSGCRCCSSPRGGPAGGRAKGQA